MDNAKKQLFATSVASNAEDSVEVDLTDSINLNATVSLNLGGATPPSPPEMPGGFELKLIKGGDDNDNNSAPYGTWIQDMDRSAERQRLLAVTEEDEDEDEDEETTELAKLTIVPLPPLSPPVIFELKYKFIPVLSHFSETTLLSWLL